jgi:hypothetical protein
MNLVTLRTILVRAPNPHATGEHDSLYYYTQVIPPLLWDGYPGARLRIVSNECVAMQRAMLRHGCQLSELRWEAFTNTIDLDEVADWEDLRKPGEE